MAVNPEAIALLHEQLKIVVPLLRAHPELAHTEGFNRWAIAAGNIQRIEDWPVDQIAPFNQQKETIR